MSALLAASRPARRDMARHPWRVLAAVLLIALPVFYGAVSLTWNASEEAALRSDFSRTTVHWRGGTCLQNVDGLRYDCTPQDPDTEPREPARQLIESRLPAGFTVQATLTSWGTASHEGRNLPVLLRQVPQDTPQAPSPGQVLLTPMDAEQLQVSTGGVVTFRSDDGKPPVELTVAGVLPGHSSVVTEPTLADPATLRLSDPSAPWAWNVSGPDDFTWEDVRALNEVGFTVHSQDVIDDPPPAAEVPDLDGESTGALSTTADNVRHLVTGLAMTLTLLLLMLLVIAPVFTIATSRMSRVFALMSSQGAAPWHIRLAVLTYGAVSGMAGATLGAAAGVATAAVMWLRRFPDWGIEVPWGYVLGVWTAAVLASTAAATLPAVLAARASISAGVQGASPDRLLRWRPWMSVGPVGLLLIGAVSLLSSDDVRSFYLPVFTLAVVLSVAAGAPGLVWVLGRIGGRAPLTVRLALRDLGRQSLRSAPALAALMAVLTVAVTALVSQQAHEARERFLHEQTFRGQQVLMITQSLPGVTPDADSVAALTDTVHGLVGASTRTDLRGSQHALSEGPVVEVPSAPEFTGEPVYRDITDGWSAHTGASVTEATPEVVGLFALDDAEREAALAALDGPALLVSSRTTATSFPLQQVAYPEDGTGREVLAEVTVPVIPVLPPAAQEVLVTPAAFAELGVTPELLGTIFSPLQPLTWEQQRDLEARVAEETLDVSLVITPREWRSPRMDPGVAGVLGLGVLVVVTLVLALSWQGARRQFALLDAVGAPPSLPSRVSGAFAGLLTLAGTSVGLVVGHLGAALSASRSVRSESGELLSTGTVQFFSPDWVLIGILGVLTPLVAWVIGRLFHRRIGEPEYRET